MLGYKRDIDADTWLPNEGGEGEVPDPEARGQAEEAAHPKEEELGQLPEEDRIRPRGDPRGRERQPILGVKGRYQMTEGLEAAIREIVERILAWHPRSPEEINRIKM
jgi:hypothetical protein